MPTQLQATEAEQPNPSDFFDDSWAVYASILDRNYMFHDEIYGKLRQFLKARYGERPFSILDLGCGSARHLADALNGLAISRYVGYDISATALQEAGRNLAVLGGNVDLRQGDLLEAVETEPGPFEFVFSSFALHHLLHEQKAELFRGAAALLAVGGIFFLIDVTRDEHEDRATYLDRYCGWVETQWTGLAASSIAQINAHIRASDFPETISRLQQMASAAGLKPAGALPSFLFHQSLAWEKA